MISPELLRRYPFFGVFDDGELKAIAVIAEEHAYESGETIFEEGKSADVFYFLLAGSVDLSFTAKDGTGPELPKEYPVGEVNPGEPFGISAFVEPFKFTTTARVSESSQVIKIDAVTLRNLCDHNQTLAYKLMQGIAKAALERLNATRVQLAAAWA